MTNDILTEFTKAHPGASMRLSSILGEKAAVEKDVRAGVAAATGILSLDLKLGGLPSGLIEYFGEESTGKTALLAHTIAYGQKSGMNVAILPTEPVSYEYLEACGVNLAALPVIPLEGLGTTQLVYDFLHAHPRAMLAIDTLTSFRPERLAHSAWNKFMWNFLQSAASWLKPDSCVVATSEVRTRKSVNPNKRYAGGTDSSLHRLSDLFSTRIELIRENVKDDSYTMLANIVANTLGRPASYVRIPMTKGSGAEINLDFLRAAVSTGVVTQTGPHFHFRGKHIGLGEEATSSKLTTHTKTEILERIFG